MAKVTFNPKYSAPVTESLHMLIEACGYHLQEQRPGYLLYETSHQRLVFQALSIVKYYVLFPPEEDRTEEWSEMFTGMFGYMMPEIDLITILITVNALQMGNVNEFKEFLAGFKTNLIDKAKLTQADITVQQP